MSVPISDAERAVMVGCVKSSVKIGLLIVASSVIQSIFADAHACIAQYHAFRACIAALVMGGILACW